MAAILQNGGHSMNNVIYFDNYEGCNHNSDLLLYILKLLNWEKLLRYAQSRCAHHAGGICLTMEDLSLSIILLFRNFQM